MSMSMSMSLLTSFEMEYSQLFDGEIEMMNEIMND